MVKLFHGSEAPAHVFLQKGIRVGDNSHGGTHGIYTPRVCLTASWQTARKYGDTIIVVEVDPVLIEANTDRDGVFYQVFQPIRAECIVETFEGEEIYDNREYLDYLQNN